MTQKPQQRRGLGRGLGSLIPTAPREEQPAPTPDGAGEAPAGDGAGRPSSSSRSWR